MFKAAIGSIIAKNMKKKIDNWTIKEEDVSELLKEIRIALLDADVNLLVVKELIKNIRQKTVGSILDGKQDPQQFVLKIIKEELINILGKENAPLNLAKNPLKIMIVGLQGSGKTTTVAKIGNFLKQKYEKKPLLVGVDIYRPAAIEQLKKLSNDNHLDFYSNGINDPVKTSKESIEIAKKNNNDVIIYDTAGRLQTNKELMDELLHIKEEVKPDEIILVVDAMSGQDIINVAKEFNQILKLSGFIITKLDSDARGGAALSLTSLINVPIKFTGTGEKVGSLDIFYPERMADRILGLGDIMTLAEKAADNIDENKAKKSLTRMMAGKMDLEDLMMQMEQMTKLGSVGTIMSMLPGAPKLSDEKIYEIEKKMIVWKVLMSSMTLKERRNPQLFKKQPNRKIRVVKGSGRKPDELNKLLSEWDKSKSKMEEIGKNLRRGKNPFSSFGQFKFPR